MIQAFQFIHHVGRIAYDASFAPWLIILAAIVIFATMTAVLR